MKDDVKTYYNQKNILITGATGFVGKAILWKLLKTMGNEINKIYILIRPKRISAGTPSQRIMDEIINTTAFQQLFDKDNLKNKLIPISYDLSLPQMGLSLEDSNQMKDTNIVIHCGSTPEYENSLEWNLETNVLGTMRLLEYAESLSGICSFGYISPLHIYQDVPEFCYNGEILEYVYDLGFGDPELFLKQLLSANEKELSTLTKTILQKYSTLHLFTKSLVEHLILKRAQNIKDKNNIKFPIAIFRSNYIGPATKEPTPGWTTGMSSVSLWLALFGHAMPVIQPDQGQKKLHMIPVDCVSQSIIETLPFLSYPETDFILPLAQIAANIDFFSSTPDRHTITYFPYVFNITHPTPPLSWFQAYTAIQDYWSRPHNQLVDQTQGLSPAHHYFSTHPTLSNARFLLQYYFRSTPAKPTKPTVINSTAHLHSLLASPLTKPDLFQQHDQQRLMDLVSQIKSNLTKQLRHTWSYSSRKLQTFSSLEPSIDWYSYLMQSCYGVHLYTLHGGLHTRTTVCQDQMECALYYLKQTTIEGKSESVIDRTFESVVYTEDELRQRVDRMMKILMDSLKSPGGAAESERQWKPIWIEYLDDMLEDWCSESHVRSFQEEMKRLESDYRGGEAVKLVVLNDVEVGEAIRQVSKRSGMALDKVTEEAKKTFNRIQERTQPSYVWFAASFLEKLFKKAYRGIYIHQESLEQVRNAVAQKKQIVYIPVSKTALDPIIVWFLSIRYNLPVPAMILDEALAILGPFSDILRLAGAVFIKRDPNARSTLSTAVTSAYLRHLIEERGAVTFILDKVRSRTGIVQGPFDDGLVQMIIQQNPNVVFIPINICYEEVLDISHLVSQDIQSNTKPAKKQNVLEPVPRRISFVSHRLSTPQKVSRPSDSRSQRVRSRSLGTSVILEHASQAVAPGPVVHFGKLLVGMGKPIELQKDEAIGDFLDRIQQEQKKAVIISPVSIVAAILLYSRVKGSSIELEEIKNHLKYLIDFINQKQVLMDVQEFESSESIVFYSIRLLEKNLSTVTLDERNSGLVFRLSSRTDCILQLAYYSIQLREICLLDSIFAVTYLSFGTRNKVFESTFFERFEFLMTLFQHHFNTKWNIRQEYELLFNKYSDCVRYEDTSLDNIIEEDEESEERKEIKSSKMIERLIDKLENGRRYNQLRLLGSFIYPIIDSYWVTLCGLSALKQVGSLPMSLVPILSQWIGMHLISGRRTIYNEVLSIEYHQNVLRSLLLFGALNKELAKLVLSPDTQMLMQVLGLSTNDQLLFSSIEFKEDKENTIDPIIELYKKIEQVRVKLEDNTVSIHIYEKCQNQIKSLIKESTGKNPFSKTYGAIISDPKEESMIQLGYALLQSMNSTNY